MAGASEALTLDLHTGHGKWGTYTVLSRALLGSDADRWVRSTFGDAAVETTVANPDATLAAKNGQLLLGIVAELGIPRVHSVTFELGTRSETRMIVAEHLEHWVHMHGDRDHPDHAAIVWDHRCCSIPDDREWERSALDHGRTVLDQALTALV